MDVITKIKGAFVKRQETRRELYARLVAKAATDALKADEEARLLDVAEVLGKQPEHVEADVQAIRHRNELSDVAVQLGEAESALSAAMRANVKLHADHAAAMVDWSKKLESSDTAAGRARSTVEALKVRRRELLGIVNDPAHPVRAALTAAADRENAAGRLTLARQELRNAQRDLELAEAALAMMDPRSVTHDKRRAEDVVETHKARVESTTARIAELEAIVDPGAKGKGKAPAPVTAGK